MFASVQCDHKPLLSFARICKFVGKLNEQFDEPQHRKFAEKDETRAREVIDIAIARVIKKDTEVYEQIMQTCIEKLLTYGWFSFAQIVDEDAISIEWD